MVFGSNGADIKGCEAVLAVAKLDFYPGELVQGQLTLNVTKDIDWQAVTLSVVGVETIFWSVPDSEGDSSYDEKKDIIRQEIPLLQPSQSTIPVGQHIFPFAFPLPSGLPASNFTLMSHGSGWFRGRVKICYEILVHIHAKGAKQQKELAKQEFRVHAIPLDRALYPGRPAKESKSTRVNFFGCFRQGDCEVSLSTDRDTCDINSGILSLNATVKNLTGLTIERLGVELCFSLDIHIPEGKHASSSKGTPHFLHKHTVMQSIAPRTTRENIPIVISMADVRLSFQKANRDLVGILCRCHRTLHSPGLHTSEARASRCAAASDEPGAAAFGERSGRRKYDRHSRRRRDH